MLSDGGTAFYRTQVRYRARPVPAVVASRAGGTSGNDYQTRKATWPDPPPSVRSAARCAGRRAFRDERLQPFSVNTPRLSRGSKRRSTPIEFDETPSAMRSRAREGCRRTRFRRLGNTRGRTCWQAWVVADFTGASKAQEFEARRKAQHGLVQLRAEQQPVARYGVSGPCGEVFDVPPTRMLGHVEAGMCIESGWRRGKTLFVLPA